MGSAGDFLKNEIVTNGLRTSDRKAEKNASAAENAGLEVRVTRIYDGVGLSGGRECQWCISRCGKDMTLDEAYEKGAFQRHPGCGCEIEYTSAKGVTTRQTRAGGRDTWTPEDAAPTNWQELKSKKEYSSADKDVLLTNPGYTSKEWKYQNNCQRCVSTYEMRRRGYDVVAKPRLNKNDSLAYYWEQAWETTNKNDMRIPCFKGSGKQEVIQHMKDWGDGSRAIVSVQWHGVDGHVFIAENNGGGIRFVDPQSGSLDCSGYFKDAQKHLTTVFRIDNRRPSVKILECCTNRKA